MHREKRLLHCCPIRVGHFYFCHSAFGFGTLYSFVSLCGHGQKSLENVVWLLLWCGSSSQCTLMRLLPSHSLYSVPKWENFDLAFDTLGSPLRCLHYYCCFTISILGGFCIGEKNYWSDCKIPVIHARLIWKSLRENDLSFFLRFRRRGEILLPSQMSLSYFSLA